MKMQTVISGLAMRALCIAGTLCGAAATAQAASRSDGDLDLDRQQAVLEGRLVAPCCWKQTLEVHESALASALRAEIGERLARGEAAAAIERDLVARFGARVRAVPEGRDPRAVASIAFGAALLLSAAWLLALGRSWIRRSPLTAGRATSATPAGHESGSGPASELESQYGDLLDDELREFDGA